MPTLIEILTPFETKNKSKELEKKLKKSTELSLLPKSIKKEVAELGLLILKGNTDYYSEIDYGTKPFFKLKELISDNIWEDKKYYKLLELFYGEELAPYVKNSWNKMSERIYQSGYYRRSFRAPNQKDYILVKQINFLRNLLTKPSQYTSEGYKYYDLPIVEQIRYSSDIGINDSYTLIWSEMIDEGNQQIYQLMEDIIYGKDPIGKVSRNIIKALLNSHKPEAWELVEKLLLSAQRQEGLRQTILETLDETSVGALQSLIKVIINEKLARFSSVVRAVDTWTGLGWEAEKETTIRNILAFADQFLTHPETIEKGIESKNNNEVYMALWSQGVTDIDASLNYVEKLLDKGTIEKKCLALKFASETSIYEKEIRLYNKALDEVNLQVFSFFLPRMISVTSSFKFPNDDTLIGLFDKVLHLAETIQEKEKTFEGKVFSWLNTKFSKDDLYSVAINLIGEDQTKLERILAQFDQLSLSLRESLARLVLKDFYSYSYYYMDQKKSTNKVSDFQREFALKVIKDRGESIIASALNTLKHTELNQTEINSIQDLFKRKGANLRKHLIQLILLQNDENISSFTQNLIEKGDAEQRLAGLDILLQLNKEKRATDFIKQTVNSFNERKKITEKETILLKQLDPKSSNDILSIENGFGIYNPANITPFELPKLDKDSVYLKHTKKNKYGFSKSENEIVKNLEQLKDLYLQNKDYEYEYEDWNNSVITDLLGNSFNPLKRNTQNLTTDEKFANYPLHETWEKWYLDSKLTPIDLYLLTLEEECDRKVWRTILENYVFYNKGKIPNPLKTDYYWNNPLKSILFILQEKFPFEDANNFVTDGTIQLFSALPKDVINYQSKRDKNNYYYNEEFGNGWQNERFFDVFLNKINLINLEKDDVQKVWNIYRWRQYNGLEENIKFNKPPLYIYCLAYQNNLITKDEMYEGILDTDRINEITSDRKNYRYQGSKTMQEDFPFLTEMIENIREKFLDVELKRGDSNTNVTQFVQSFEHIYGINRFVEILDKLGKAKLFKGYIYSWRYTDVTKQKLFSFLIKRCLPLETDTQEEFNQLVKKAKISESRLIEASVYAPQWQKLVSNYLDWKGLDAAIWWMHAHTKTSGYQAENAELESEVAKYSSIDIQDFKDGAVDKDWFTKAYKELGKSRWEILYEAAKYISDGNGHRRARLYADTLTGDLKIREVTAKVKDKRDQDYLRVYGLVPLSKTNAEKDVLSRYEYLQQFKKESREFGSMKQTSEALALRVALENLARNAGYPDPIRLTWAMESQQVQQILSKDTQVEIDGTTIGLIIDEDGKADLVTFKGDKQLKSIPPKLKKDKAVVELTNYRKTLREQFTRSRKGLEEAMIRGDDFLFSEIENLFSHPIISKHLEKLVFISSKNTIGFYVNGQLKDAKGNLQSIDSTEMFRIAHCYDLHQNSVWSDYQHYCFDQKLKQPFKQIFRELYIPTADELKEKSISRRYAGHQVQPKQTLALLKTRGWKVDYEEGLQKVFHKEGYQVKLYAMADWFSPADVESPTLETVEFHSLKTHKNIPFEEINPRIFSEVMRDIDLVVSVAHVGGVDPEASHSTIEMRSVLLNETARLFKLKNVETKGSHAYIKGEMAEYSVHLGSAVVHQVPGLYLSILPVQSQHRGRIFLPFADDDPKSAEVISKVLLLAKDNEIKDPTILSQIKREIN